MKHTIKSPPMTRQHYEFIADLMGPMVTWPSHLIDIADALEKTNPKFARKKFPECDGTGVVVYASLNDDIPLRSCNNCSGKGYVEMDELDWLE
jgi:hypothetical protein